MPDFTLPEYAVPDQPIRPRPCSKCGAPMAMVKTKAGKWAPIDPDGTSHFATCPAAAFFRRPKP